MKRYIVKLSQEERTKLESLISKGSGAAKRLTHARILLKADSGEWGEGWTDEKTAQALNVSVATVEQVRQRLVEGGVEAALNRKKHSRTRSRKLDGDGEARLVTLACSEAPDGRSRWTLQLLADRMVELAYVDSLSDESVRRTLKKTK